MARRSRPTLRQLEYLLAVAETLNFRAAAAASHVSQPALSQQIRLLEEQLGVTLLERDKRSTRLTKAGEIVVGQARAVLADVDGLVDAALGQGEPLSGTLRLGAIPTVAPYLLPGLLRGAAERHPRLRVVVQEAQTSSLLEGLRVNRVDVALLALPQKGFAIRFTRSVSHLAAPAFAAAAVGSEVVATVPVGDRRVVLFARLRVPAGSLLEGRLASSLGATGVLRVLAVADPGSEEARWSFPADEVMDAGEEVVVAATRAGLGELLHLAATPRERGSTAG